jgi:hypothetical protein
MPGALVGTLVPQCAQSGSYYWGGSVIVYFFVTVVEWQQINKTTFLEKIKFGYYLQHFSSQLALDTN